MHIMKRGLNYLRSRRATKDPPPDSQKEAIQSVDAAELNSSWSPESNDRSLSSTGATLSSGPDEDSPSSSTTDQENYYHFKQDLNFGRHQQLRRMSTRRVIPPIEVPNPPPSPEEFRSASRVTIPRCSSGNSLDIEMMEEDRPASSATAPEVLYSRIQKDRRPRKRVCFRDPMSLSAIEEVSPVASTSSKSGNLENVVPRRLAMGFASPCAFKSPLPKTNPHFTLPKSFGTQLRNRMDYSSAERVCSYYDSDDGSFSSYNSNSGEGSRIRKCRSGNSTVGLQRVLAGLKSFGIKGW